MDNVEIGQRLRDLGIRLEPKAVKYVVTRLYEGFSKASIYDEDPRQASKKTVEKIEHLLKQEKLNWILDEEVELKQLEELGQILAPLDTSASQLDGSKTGTGYPIFKMPRDIDRGVLEGAFRTGLDVYENRWNQIVDSVPSVEWSLNTLLGVGIKESTALDILSRRDKAMWDLAKKTNFKTMHEVISLYFLVDFYRSLGQSEYFPHYVIEWAGEYYAEGLINNNELVKNLAKGVIKYQAWRSDKHYKAMVESLNITDKEKRFVDKKRRYFQPATKPIQIYR